MFKTLTPLIAALALAASGAAANAADFTFSGNLIYNTDVVQFDITVAAPGTFTLWTDSWRSGLNFDPTLALFDAGFALVTVGDDTPDPGALLPGQGGYDSQIRFSAASAGTFHLALTASGNDAIGPMWSHGFSLQGTTPILISEWNQPSYDINANDQKGTFWRLHVDGVSSVSAVPEPDALALMLAGCVGIAVARMGRKRRDS